MKSLNGLLPPSYGTCETAGEDVQHLSLELTCIRLICSSCQVSMDTDRTKLPVVVSRRASTWPPRVRNASLPDVNTKASVHTGT